MINEGRKMKRFFAFLVFVSIILSGQIAFAKPTCKSKKVIINKGITWEPFIQNLVNQVNTDSMLFRIQRLQDFRTRLALTDSSFAASISTWSNEV